MLPHLNAAAVAATSLTAFLILFSNPRRGANRAIACGIVLLGIWIIIRNFSMLHPHQELWYLMCVSIGPLILALLIIATELISYNTIIPRNPITFIIFFLTFVLSAMPWHSSFADNFEHGFRNNIGFYAYAILNIIAYGTSCLVWIFRARKLSPQKASELKIIAYPSITLGISICTLMLIRTFSPNLIPSGSSHALVVVYVACLAYLFSTSKAFHAAYAFRMTIRITMLILSSTVIATLLTYTLHTIVPAELTSAISGVIILIANKYFPQFHKIGLKYGSNSKSARLKIIEAAVTTIDEARLAKRLRMLIAAWGNSKVKYLGPLDDEPEIKFAAISSYPELIPALIRITWATPERLRSMSEFNLGPVFTQFMLEQDIGIITLSADRNPILIALKNRADRRPFTVRDAQQLIEYASLASLAFSRVRLLSQVAHADRLVTLGILGASIAHEIRNPLFAIKTFADLLPTHYDSPEFRLQFSKMVGEEAKRIDSLLSDMMTLGKPRELHFSATQINAAVVDTVNLLGQKTRSSKIEVNCDLSARHDTIDTDAALIRQVILNLFLNAIQALHDFPGDRQIDLFTANTDRGFEFAIRDSGPGIPPKDRKKLFVRFNTSKKDGTGLGLWLCRELVTSLGGSLDIDPYVPGEGATFRMILPQSQLESPSAPKLESAG